LLYQLSYIGAMISRGLLPGLVCVAGYIMPLSAGRKRQHDGKILNTHPQRRLLKKLLLFDSA
jgi:folate-dependent phosphoribosylglycinamide formyltransferase PurN